MVELDWMHPSYRDLIIDELIFHRDLRIQFLKTATLRDLGLALSDAGGPDGQRKMPFIVDDESKGIVCKRFIDLAKELNDIEIDAMLEILGNSIKESEEDAIWVISLLNDVMKLLLERWNGKVIWSSTLVTYCKVTLFFRPLNRLPDFEPTWNALIHQIENSLESGDYLEAFLIEKWMDLIDLLQKNEPRFLTQIEFPRKYIWLYEKIIDYLEEEMKWRLVAPTEKEISDEIERIDDLIKSTEKLRKVIMVFDQRFFAIIQSFEQMKNELLELVHPEPDYDMNEEEYYQSTYQGFDVDRLFADL